METAFRRKLSIHLPAVLYHKPTGQGTDRNLFEL